MELLVCVVVTVTAATDGDHVTPIAIATTTVISASSDISTILLN